MKRELEPEIMEGAAQVKAYVEADFTEPNSHFIDLFINTFAQQQGYVLDLGCGSGDISYRFAEANPDCVLHAVDASATMLDFAENDKRKQSRHNLSFFKRYLPTQDLPRQHYDVIISNSLLHHLPDPHSLWQTVKLYSKAKTAVFIADLIRPPNKQQARELVKTYAASEPDILQHDFYHSLLAAFEVDEIKAQLKTAELNLNCKTISDRHLMVYGYL